MDAQGMTPTPSGSTQASRKIRWRRWAALAALVGAGAWVISWWRRPTEVEIVAASRGTAVDAVYATATLEPLMQKQRDIAILRAVGFRRGDILQMFLLQGVILALLGGLTGDLLAKIVLSQLALMRVHTESLVQSDRFLVHDDPGFYLTALLFAALLGVFASVVPAWRASKVEPVDVLRGMVG